MKGNVTSLGMHSEMPSPRGQHVNLTRPSGLQGGHVNGEEGRSSWRASHTPPARPALCHWEPLPGPPTGRPGGLYLDPLPTGARAQNTHGSTIPVPTLTQPSLNAKSRPGPRGAPLPVSASPRPAGLQPTQAYLARSVQAAQTLEDGEGPWDQKGCRSRPRVASRCPRERTRRRAEGTNVAEATLRRERPDPL